MKFEVVRINSVDWLFVMVEEPMMSKAHVFSKKFEERGLTNVVILPKG